MSLSALVQGDVSLEQARRLAAPLAFAVCLLSACFYFCTDPLRAFFYALTCCLCLRLSGESQRLAAPLTVLAAGLVCLAALLVPVDLVDSVYVAFELFLVQHFWQLASGWSALLYVAAVVAGAGVGAVLPVRGVCAWLTAGLLLSFAWSALFFDAQIYALFSVEPQNPQHDTMDLLKTYYLLKQGVGYYDACWGGWRMKYATVWSYRQPLLYTTWAMLPGDGRTVLYSYIALACTSSLAAWTAVRRWAGPTASLLAAQLVLALYFKGLYTLFPTAHEYWAVGLVMIALALVSRDHWSMAVLFLTLAMMVREHSGIFMVTFIVVAAWTGRRRAAWLGGLGTAVWAGFYVLHVRGAMANIALHGQAPVSNLSDRGAGSLGFVLKTLHFGATTLAGHDLVIAAVVLGCLAVTWTLRGRPAWVAFAVVPLWLYLAAFTVVGSPAADYWGALYLPAAYTAFSLLFGREPAGAQGEEESLPERVKLPSR